MRKIRGEIRKSGKKNYRDRKNYGGKKSHGGNYKENWVVLGFFLLSLLLCFYKLGTWPTFISDEASIGYNAWSILKTGRDEWGHFLPLTFKAFGEHKLPFYIYASVLPISFLGLSEFSTRFISAFFGALSGFFIYLLAQSLFPSKKKTFGFPLIVFFLFLINPWHLQTSRMALEANLALFLFLVGFCFLLKENFFFSAVFFGLTFYTYNAFRVFIPLFIFLAFLFKGRKIRKLFPSGLVFLLIILPLVFSGFKGSGERVFKTSIFTDPGLVSRIEQRRVNCQKHLAFGFCRLVYNRPVVYTSEIFKNYFSHFDPRFLFTRGAGLAQYGMPAFGVVNFFEIFLLPFGFWLFLKDGGLKEKLLPWLLAAPVATSFTGPVHPVRSLVLMPVLVIISALGANFILGEKLKLRRARKNFFAKDLDGRVKILGILGMGMISLAYFLYRYFWVYPAETGSIWQSGYKSLYEYLGNKEFDFNQLIVSKYYGEPHIFYLFYHRFDPAVYQKGGGVARYDREDRWVNVDRIGKYFFWDQNDFASCWDLLADFAFKKQGRTLIVLAADENLAGEKPDELIDYQNREAAFAVYEIKN